MDRLIKILSRMEKKKILVVGDIMLDKYIWGEVKRISPEAPVQVVNVKKESYMPGGAGNAANNIASLKGIPYLVGIIGDDNAKDTILNILNNKCINTEGIIISHDIQTTQKIRVIAKSQQLVRIDYESRITLKETDNQKMINFIESIIKEIDIILISDYSKGVINKTLMMAITNLSKKYGKKIIIDPKPKNSPLYKDCFLITPNLSEAMELSGLETNDSKVLGKKILDLLNCNVLITKSEEGMSLIGKDSTLLEIPTKAREVYDVSGAGDTAVAVLSLALAAGASLGESAIISNYAAGISVGKIGTSTVSLDELEKAVKDDK